MIDLKGHAALITGSSKGVGRAIALSFAQAGAAVVIHGRAMGPDAQEVMDRCRALGVKAEFVAGDLSGPTASSVEEVYSGALRVLPSIDILVNNAGQYFDVPFLDMDLARFEKTLRLNISSGYFLTQRFARYWIENNIAGRVLFIGSINGRLAEPVSTAYDTSKGAVEMMVKTLGITLAPHRIRVNGLAPGLVLTPQTSWVESRPEDGAWLRLHTPNGQIPDASVCGPGAVYLCSDAAEHVIGQMLLVDGGMSAWQQPPRPA